MMGRPDPAGSLQSSLDYRQLKIFARGAADIPRRWAMDSLLNL
jgi:hypothetical protein